MKTNSRIDRLVEKIVSAFKRWIDIDRNQKFFRYILNVLKKLFVLQPSYKSQSFDKVIHQLHLSDQEINARQKNFYRISMVMGLGALSLIGYGLYHLCLGNLKASLMSISISLIAIALSFRYHFWYFQIKHRKLGCSFREWYQQGFWR